MKKITFAIAIFCFTFFLSQNKNQRYFSTQYILKNSNDTIRAKIRNTGIYSNKKYSLYTILMKMKMVDSDGNTIWIKPKEIKYIKITDNENVEYEYFDSSEKFLKEEGLVRVIYEGKNINWYQSFDNPKLLTNITFKGYIVDKNKNIIDEYYFEDSKNRFKKLFQDYPDLQEKVKSLRTDEDYIDILKLYDVRLDKTVYIISSFRKSYLNIKLYHI